MSDIDICKMVCPCSECSVEPEDCRMADAWMKQLHNGWIPVTSGRLPKNEERVFISSDRKTYSGKVMKIRTIAMYEDGTIHTDKSGYSWEDHDFEYDEEADDYIIPEGWWEQSMYCEEFGMVDDFVTHWMPLPEYPESEVLE